MDVRNIIQNCQNKSKKPIIQKNSPSHVLVLTKRQKYSYQTLGAFLLNAP